MAQSKISTIKHAQRSSFILREVSELFLKIAMDDVTLQELYITRVELSPDRGVCTIFFHTPAGNEGFQKLMPTLISETLHFRQEYGRKWYIRLDRGTIQLG